MPGYIHKWPRKKQEAKVSFLILDANQAISLAEVILVLFLMN